LVNASFRASNSGVRVTLSLSGWESFYVITGSSAAALTGLMFVVIALAADRLQHAPHDGLSAFSTPTVAHFCIVLLVASLMTMPLRHVITLGVCLGGGAAVGLTSTFRAGMRMRKLETYEAVVVDWAFNVVLPFLAYLVLLGSAILLGTAQDRALFAVAGVVLVLLFLGIRNAWDVAIFLVTTTLADGDTKRGDTKQGDAAAQPTTSGQRPPAS
jgi:hypothetical protein